MTGKPGPSIGLRALGDASIISPMATIDPSAEMVFAAALYLIVERTESVSRRSFQAILWPGASARVASHRMRQTLLKLRRLGLPIELGNKGYVSLAAESVSVDYEEFLTAKSLHRNGNDALVLLPAYEPRFSQPYMEWVDTWKAEVNASMTRVMLGIIARHRVKGEWVEVERNASRLLRFQPYNEEATLAMAEAYAMRGGKLQGVEILDRYLSEVGRGPTDLRLPATVMRRRIADRVHPRAEAVVGQSPLVGRSAVMEQLGELLQRSRERKGHACLVWGDAGVGKSRLLAEFATFASLQGVAAQRVQCMPNDRHRPLSVFVDLVPALRNMRGAIGCSAETFGYLDRLTKHRPTIMEVRSTEGDSEFVYAGIQQALFDLIDAVSDEACLIVLIEDVHWLDSTSARLLGEMVAWAADHSILFAFTGRDRPDNWLGKIPESLTEIHLPPLDAGPSKDVILGVVRQHGREIDDTYLGWCVRVAEGNPYFLQELANHWVETGDQQEVPSSLAAVLNERISRLGTEALLLLQTCALLEKNATLDRIEKLIGFEAHRMLPAINELGLAGMLVIEADELGKTGADRLLSRHDLLSNAALARLTPPARAFLHRRAGSVFESEIDHEGSASALWDCAKHWQLAGNVGRAFQLAKSCATHLMEVGLPGAAAEAYEKSLAYCTTPAETEQILEGQAHAYYRNRSWDRVSDVVAKARRVSLSIDPERDLHDELELMALHAEWPTMHYDRILDRALKCLHESTATAKHRVEAGSMSLMLLDQICDHDAMPRVYELVERLSPFSGVTVAARLQAATVYHTACGSLEIGVAAARSLVDEQRTNGNVGDLIRSLGNASLTFRTAGLLEESEKVLLEALSVSDRHKIEMGYTQTLTRLVNLAFECGRIEDARRWSELLRVRPVAPGDELTPLEIAAFSIRLALLGNRPSDARKYFPCSLPDVRRDPLAFRRTYWASLFVASELGCGRIPSEALLGILEEAHLRSRRSFFQAYPAYALYVGLLAAGKEDHASRLLSEYLTIYRRESSPAPNHLLTGLERLVPLTRKKRSGRRRVPTLLAGDNRS